MDTSGLVENCDPDDEGCTDPGNVWHPLDCVAGFHLSSAGGCISDYNDPEWVENVSDPSESTQDAGCPGTEIGRLNYWCLTNSGTQYNTVKKALSDLASLLKSDQSCLDWLMKETFNKRKGLAVAIRSMSLGVAQDIDIVGSNPVLHPGGVANVTNYDIIINMSIFLRSNSAGQRETLIHEIAHVLAVPGMSSEMNNAGEVNMKLEDDESKLIRANCAKTLSSK